jgi:hypothetical protein
VTIFVDEPRWLGRSGMRFAHLVSDTSFDELHAFVAAFEPRLRFHRDHYDVPAHRWEQAVERGAVVVSAREIVRLLRAAGLRRTTAAGTAPRRRSG